MKRSQIIDNLIKEGFTEKTLVRFSDKQLLDLHGRIIGEAVTKQVQVYSMKDPNDAKEVNAMINDPKKVADMKAKGHVEVTTESKPKVKPIKKELKEFGPKPNLAIKQFLSKLKDEGISLDSFLDDPKQGSKTLRNMYDVVKERGYSKEDIKNKNTSKEDVKEMLRFYDDEGKEIKDKKGKISSVSTNDKDFEKKVKSKKDDKEVKKEKIEETKKWIKTLAENSFHSFTSKGEIMELIQTKVSDVDMGSKVKKGHNGIPEFMTYDSIVTAAEPKEKPQTRPTETPTKDPGTKQPPKKDPRKTPFQPGPGPNPKPKALKERK
jgi:hypothetical protein